MSHIFYFSVSFRPSLRSSALRIHNSNCVNDYGLSVYTVYHTDPPECTNRHQLRHLYYLLTSLKDIISFCQQKYFAFHQNVNLYDKSVILKQLECGPMPNLMIALQNIGGALCSTPQSLARGHCSTAVQVRVKHCAKFGWLPLSDVAAVTKPRRESR